MNYYFENAYKMAVKAFNRREIPVGCVITKNGKIIAKSFNNRQKNYNILGHAEINCILKSEKKLKDWRLDGCFMYVTLEPCDLCAKIIKEARIDHVFFLIDNKKSKHLLQNMTQTNDCDAIKNKYLCVFNDFFKKLRH